MTDPWWQGAVGYQIYIRSFADSNGDGIGDLRGIVQHLDYLEWLGVDAIWITPFYPSPGFDHGYDVSNYKDVNPIHGSLRDFDALIEGAHERNLRVLMDIVPNHTSSLHPWFIESRSSRDNPKRDWYVWADPKVDTGLPNNWVSQFGGSAWTLDEETGQFYLHLFLEEQPDLNWANEEVRKAFDETLRFWLDRGVDGFRVDVAHGLIKDDQLRDNPRVMPVAPDSGPGGVFWSYEHRHDIDQPGNVEIFRRWKKVLEPHGALLVGEVALHRPEALARYVADGLLDMVFFLRPSQIDWDPAALVRTLTSVHDAAPQQISWVLNNHDNSRSVTRFGGGPPGAERSLAVTTLQMALGGMPFLYQGEELGLDDAVIEPEDVVDPVATRNEGATGRDSARSPMPWDESPGNGFTTAPVAWLVSPPRKAVETVSAQQKQPSSFVHRYHKLLEVRRSLPAMWQAEAEWLIRDTDGLLALRRGEVLVVANMRGFDSVVELPEGRWRPAYCSQPDLTRLEEDKVIMPPDAAAILTNAD